MELQSEEILAKRIKEGRNSLSTDRLDMSFGEIMHMYQSEEIIISPEFQRLFRWDESQKTRFIESLLLGIPIPPIFVAEDKDGKWELVDGLQRLSTLFSFFGILRSPAEANGWKLCKADLIASIEGYSLETLPLKFRLNIKRVACRVEIIRSNSQMDMRYELFNRLNTGGSPLADQEIRNCIHRGTSSAYNNYLISLAANPDFISLIEPTKKQKDELYLQELVLRWSSLLFNHKNVKKALSHHLSDFMYQAVRDTSCNYDRSELFEKIVSIILPLGKIVFRGKNGGFSASYYDAIMVGIGQNIDFYAEQPVGILETRISDLKSNQDFKQRMGSASNSRYRVVTRIEIALGIFSSDR